MCGIFGYTGNKNSFNKINQGLKRLEYRGYDSWGIATLKNGTLELEKTTGEIELLNKDKDSTIGIGHTRWATHGGVKKVNAHPHFSTDKSFVLAQNGIVENFQELKKELINKRYVFKSETDTEVIVRLVEDKLKSEKTLLKAIKAAFLELAGRNTIIVLDSKTDEIIAVRNGSPLVIGIKKNEVYIASDTLSFANETKEIIEVENNQLIHVKKDKSIILFDLIKKEEVKYEVKTIDIETSSIDKEGYDHFMIKEIMEQPQTILDATTYEEEEFKNLIEEIKRANRVFLTGAGTAFYAASQIATYLRSISKIYAQEVKAYEMDSYKELIGKGDLVIAISQSGETADTLEAIKIGKDNGAKVASLVNMLGSTITKESDYRFFSRSGPEICVASTKAFTAQISWGYLLAKTIIGDYKIGKDIIKKTSQKLTNYLKDEQTHKDIKELSEKLAIQNHFFILGKGENYNIALEGALKIKEITYKHFEGFPAGELKHGVIALIEEGVPIFSITSENEDEHYMISATAEVKARGGYTIGVSNKNNDLYDYYLKVPNNEEKEFNAVYNTVPFQLISYYLGILLKNNPDKPRNLAKSVTVK